ncbi:hypothetical protein EXIGLDRAFT_787952 [Exidia glandulosa HHB12029]|uniref:Retrotransposon gag domain-containing protein n=1 Tax=Exidia glandulosa HHB12029 TaxID=1314781 RepID=A0A165IH92_EXIGL|nr:hypothetical protein EXIGLDRAFT_787952 [Exidia glandulosa HHB12029]
MSTGRRQTGRSVPRGSANPSARGRGAPAQRGRAPGAAHAVAAPDPQDPPARMRTPSPTSSHRERMPGARRATAAATPPPPYVSTSPVGSSADAEGSIDPEFAHTHPTLDDSQLFDSEPSTPESREEIVPLADVSEETARPRTASPASSNRTYDPQYFSALPTPSTVPTGLPLSPPPVPAPAPATSASTTSTTSQTVPVAPDPRFRASVRTATLTPSEFMPPRASTPGLQFPQSTPSLPSGSEVHSTHRTRSPSPVRSPISRTSTPSVASSDSNRVPASRIWAEYAERMRQVREEFEREDRSMGNTDQLTTSIRRIGLMAMRYSRLIELLGEAMSQFSDSVANPGSSMHRSLLRSIEHMLSNTTNNQLTNTQETLTEMHDRIDQLFRILANVDFTIHNGDPSNPGRIARLPDLQEMFNALDERFAELRDALKNCEGTSSSSTCPKLDTILDAVRDCVSQALVRVIDRLDALDLRLQSRLARLEDSTHQQREHCAEKMAKARDGLEDLIDRRHAEVLSDLQSHEQKAADRSLGALTYFNEEFTQLKSSLESSSQDRMTTKMAAIQSEFQDLNGRLDFMSGAFDQMMQDLRRIRNDQIGLIESSMRCPCLTRAVHEAPPAPDLPPAPKTPSVPEKEDPFLSFYRDPLRESSPRRPYGFGNNSSFHPFVPPAPAPMAPGPPTVPAAPSEDVIEVPAPAVAPDLRSDEMRRSASAPADPNRKPPKADTLPKFYGNGDDIDLWISRVTKMYTQMKWPTSYIVDNIPILLKGDALAWFDALSDEVTEHLVTWDDWADELRQAFRIANYSSHKANELRNRRLRPGESYAEYFTARTTLQRVAMPGANDEQRILDLMAGLPIEILPHLKSGLNAEPKRTLTAFRRVLLDLEPAFGRRTRFDASSSARGDRGRQATSTPRGGGPYRGTARGRYPQPSARSQIAATAEEVDDEPSDHEALQDEVRDDYSEHSDDAYDEEDANYVESFAVTTRSATRPQDTAPPIIRGARRAAGSVKAPIAARPKDSTKQLSKDNTAFTSRPSARKTRVVVSTRGARPGAGGAERSEERPSAAQTTVQPTYQYAWLKAMVTKRSSLRRRHFDEVELHDCPIINVRGADHLELPVKLYVNPSQSERIILGNDFLSYYGANVDVRKGQPATIRAAESFTIRGLHTARIQARLDGAVKTPRAIGLSDNTEQWVEVYNLEPFPVVIQRVASPSSRASSLRQKATKMRRSSARL